jgi:sugar phosphate isomerase/epimerase
MADVSRNPNEKQVMLQVRIAVDLASLHQPLRKSLETAAGLGAAAVQLDARGEIFPGRLSQTGVRHLRRLLDDLNLRVAALSFRTRRGYNVIEQLERRVEVTRQVMQLAYDLGSRVVTNHVGQVPGEQVGPEWDLLVDVLGQLGQHGQHVGVMLAATTGSEEPAHLKQLLEALPDGLLNVHLDPGQLMINGFSTGESSAMLAPHVSHVHATDAVHDLARGRAEETKLGQGSVDFPEILGLLEQQGYDGYFTVGRQSATQSGAEIKEAIQYLRSF